MWYAIGVVLPVCFTYIQSSTCIFINGHNTNMVGSHAVIDHCCLTKDTVGIHFTVLGAASHCWLQWVKYVQTWADVLVKQWSHVECFYMYNEHIAWQSFSMSPGSPSLWSCSLSLLTFHTYLSIWLEQTNTVRCYDIGSSCRFGISHWLMKTWKW